jgi:hemerythrin-like domain-containing protein
MRTLQVLAWEHAAIAACCDRFEAEIDAIVIRSEVDAEALDRLLQFFEHEVDGHHQEKEERIFMPRLLSRASGEDVEALRAMFSRPPRAAKLLAHMRNQIRRASPTASRTRSRSSCARART